MYGLGAIIAILIGINEFVAVTSYDGGAVSFFISEIFKSFDKSHDKTKWSPKEREEILGHMTFSLESYITAEKILREKLESGKITNKDREQIVLNINNAVKEASLVSDSSLYKVHPELPKQFRDNYQTGLTKIAKGIKEGNRDEFQKGAQLYEEFQKWGNTNKSFLTLPPK